LIVDEARGRAASGSEEAHTTHDTTPHLLALGMGMPAENL